MEQSEPVPPSIADMPISSTPGSRSRLQWPITDIVDELRELTVLFTKLRFEPRGFPTQSKKRAGNKRSGASTGLGHDGKEGKKLLATCGLTNAIIDEAKTLVQKLRHMAGPLPDLAKMAAEEANFEKAEPELWAWYLEWSTIARNAIKQRSLLKKMGFLRDEGREVEEEQTENENASGNVEPAST